MKNIFIIILLMLSFNVGNSQLSSSQENEFCRVLKQMIEASKLNFEPIKSERKKGIMELYYTSRLALPTSADTKIILNGEHWYLSCKMQEKTNKDALEKNYNQLLGIVKECLKSWKQFTPEKGVITKQKAIAFKDNHDEECGPTLILSMAENPAKHGMFKIMLTIQNN